MPNFDEIAHLLSNEGKATKFLVDKGVIDALERCALCDHPAKRKEKRKKQEKSVSITKPQSHDNQKPLEHHHGRSMYKSEEKMICFHVPCRTW